MRIDAIATGVNPPEDVNVIIEVPIGGEPIKYEMDKAAGTLVVDRFLHTPMRYPGNYGFVPHTLSEDGDPIDVLVASTRPIVPGAPVVACIRKEHVAIRKLPPGGTARYGGLIGEVRAASFLGADEEYVVDLDGVELRSIQPPTGAQAGDMVEVTIRPENCTVFADGEGLKSP